MDRDSRAHTDSTHSHFISPLSTLLFAATRNEHDKQVNMDGDVIVQSVTP